MPKFQTILKTLDSADEYILKSDIYDPIIKLLDEIESLSLKTKDLLQKLLNLYSYKLKFYFIDHQDISYKLENNLLTDDELMSLLKVLLDYEKRHL